MFERAENSNFILLGCVSFDGWMFGDVFQNFTLEFDEITRLHTGRFRRNDAVNTITLFGIELSGRLIFLQNSPILDFFVGKGGYLLFRGEEWQFKDINILLYFVT